MRKLSTEQRGALQEARRGDIWPYAIVDGLKSLCWPRTAESLLKRGFLSASGSGYCRVFRITPEGRAALEKAEADVLANRRARAE